MLCSDTSGTMPAIHLDREDVELAVEIKKFRAFMKESGHQEGSMLLRFQHDFVPSIEYIFRKFRKKAKLN